VKLLKVLKMLSVAALALTAGSYAAADGDGWYVGANFGEAMAKIANDRITDELAAQGITVTALNDDEHHFGYKLFGGYQFNRYFALESGYFNLGRFGFTADTAPPGQLAGNIKLQGTNFDAVGLLPFTDKFSAFARAGVDYTWASDEFAGYGDVIVPDPRRSDNSVHYKFGAGLQYAITRSFDVRAEAERYRVNDAVGNRGDIDLFSLGVVYRFGQTGPAPAAYVPPPTPPAPPPPPEPQVAAVVEPAPVLTQSYCSILDIEFEINNDEMRREEKEKLRVLGTFLTKYPNTTAVIEGHTDNVGNAEDNKKLSQRRADNVVSYLVGDLHIANFRLQAVGYGDTRPVADNATQEGKRENRRIDAVVACATDVEGLSVKPARVTMALLIDFDPEQAEVKPHYHDDLRNVADFLKAHPTVTATIEGHTANTQATPALAQALSLRRAQNILKYLVDNFGIDSSRLTAEGYGDTRRFAYNTTFEGQQENRRVNIIINYGK
jgi:OmpA-OmpF porin, OOP family